jgi:putative SOS response-associated peptidase YedK
MSERPPSDLRHVRPRWKDPETEEWLRTCTIITTKPNTLVAQIHPRMPVILPEEAHAAWLGETEDGNLKDLLKPYPADEMQVWEISQRVNNPKNHDPPILEY